MNPYDSPTVDEIGLDSDQPPPRPIGVAILAVLHTLAGVAFGALLTFLIANAEDNEAWFRQKGLPFAWFAVICALFVLVAMACGVGMWFGTKWSWWLAAFYYFFMLFGDVCQLLLMFPLKVIAHDYQAVTVLLVRQGVGGIIHFAILHYLFQGNVLRFFGLSSQRKLRALGIMFAITIVLLMATTVLVVVTLIRNRA